MISRPVIGNLLASFLAIGSAAAQAIPAFPGAEGYGGYAKGGRGGDVYIVTNLSGASVPGSFRYGIETVPSAGRTIVFAVSGHIHINGLRLTGSKVTIAGQTAPGDGVGLVDGTFRISGDDVVVRHMRFRHRKSGSGGDCVNLDSGSLNSVLDSVSMQFSTDENFSSFNSPPENVTMQWSVNAWGLESHSCGGLWDQNHATAHHTLWAHNHTRNPKARPGGLLEWTNNVTFDWDIGFIMGDSETPASWKANVRNSYFLCPPGNLRSKALEKANLDRNGVPNFSLYLNNSRHDNDGDGILNGTDKGYAIASGNYTTLAAPASNTGAIPVTMDDPVVAFKKVVSKSGALRLEIDPAKPLRDEVDTRLIQNLVTQTANHITRESDLAGVTNGGIGTLNSTSAPLDADQDGMPDFYETALGWNPAVQDHNTALANSGGVVTGTTFLPPATPVGAGALEKFTRLEEYLHYLAIPHGTVAKNTVDVPTSVQVDLRKFTSGFSASPTFTVANLTGGAIVLSGTGNSIATFTATLNYVGRGRFDFTVTDSAGHSWTQTCALVVTASGLPRDLKWQGGLSANAWDIVANNWLRNGSVTAFSTGDRVRFDDGGSKTPALNVTETVSPGSVDFDATGNYTLSGMGAVTSSGPLTKRGSGSLTISNTGVNSITGTTLDAGTISFGNETANGSGLGTGPVTMNSGTLNQYNTGPGGSYTGNTPNPLVVNGDVSLNAAARCGLSGALSGAGTLNLFIPFTRTDWGGNPALFSGTLNVLSDGDGGEFRINSGGSGNITNYGAARIWLPNNMNAYYLPNPPSSGDKTQTIQIGELKTSGSGAGVILGGANGAPDRSVHWKVGALNTSTTFGGSIQNRTGPAHFTKLGTGTLTLTGASTSTGATTVSAGGLLIDGSLGNTTVTVASGALLGGDGILGGLITANAGAFISPGTVPFTGATLTANNGLALNGNTLYFDMSNTPGGANDRIAMNGTLALTGNQYFQFLLLQGPLTAGTYDLITGATNSTASSVGLTHNLPSDSRQTFTLNRSAAGSNPSKVWLAVTGDPATLTWTGTTNGAWDTTSAGNWTGATPNTFYTNDDVVLNDTATTRNVTLTGNVAPRTASVTTTLGYTFGGTGILSGPGSLTKAGAGTLTIANTSPNTFSGGLTLNAGTIALGNDIANAGGIGTGLLTLNGGVLSMFDNMASYNSFTAALNVPTGATARINADSRVDVYGSLIGAGTLNFHVPNVRTDLFTNWSAFTGTINVLTDSNGGDFRMASAYSFPGFPQAVVALTDKVWAYYTGTLAEGAGTTIEIGALSGPALAVLQGGATGGRALTYRIGGRNTDAVFSGNIQEQNAGTATTYVKTGSGIWTLGGNGSWNGGTSVEQGTLKITGTMASASAVNVSSGATLDLTNGSLATDVVNIDSGAILNAYGVLASDLNANGTLNGRGFGSGIPGTLAVSGSAFLGSSSLTRLRGGVSSDLVVIDGDLSLGGTVQVNLAPGTTFGRYPLMTCGGAITGSAILTGIPGGTTAKLSSSIPGRLDLVIDDSDEDGLPDSWEMQHLGNLASTGESDSDGDGQGNAIEFLAGTNPASGFSRFAATVDPLNATQLKLTWPSVPGKLYQIQTNGTLAGTWNLLTTLPAAASPAASTSYSVTKSPGSKFYRIAIVP